MNKFRIFPPYSSDIFDKEEKCEVCSISYKQFKQRGYYLVLRFFNDLHIADISAHCCSIECVNMCMLQNL